jgi:midasin
MHAIVHQTLAPTSGQFVDNSECFGISPFTVSKGNYVPTGTNFNYTLDAPATARNLIRILRSLQLQKPILLVTNIHPMNIIFFIRKEVQELEKLVLLLPLLRPLITGSYYLRANVKWPSSRIVRINLSEQTDMMDLLGTDLPIEGGRAGEFQWSDGILLKALKASLK